MKIKTKTPLSTIQTQFPGLISGSEGSLDTFISELTSPQSAGPESLVFTSNTQELKEAYLKGSRAFVVSTKIKSETSAFHGAAFLFSPNVTLALAKISDALASDRLHTYHLGPDIHPTAVIAKTATLAVGVKIGPHVVIGENTKIGTGTVIGANSCIEGDTEIGENTMIYPLNFIGRRTLIGSGCEIKPSCSIGAPGYGFAHDEKGRHYQIPQTGRVVIEDDVTIGSGCTIDRATFDETRIGQGTKLDNLVHIAHNVKIGKYCLLTGGFMSAGSSTIGNHVVSGGRVSVTDHITICDNVQLGGMSGVSKDITSPGAYAGYPLQPIKDHLKSTVTIALLPKMRKDIVRILKHLGLKEEGNES